MKPIKFVKIRIFGFLDLINNLSVIRDWISSLIAENEMTENKRHFQHVVTPLIFIIDKSLKNDIIGNNVSYNFYFKQFSLKFISKKLFAENW